MAKPRLATVDENPSRGDDQRVPELVVLSVLRSPER